jgi:hypothetical protein
MQAIKEIIITNNLNSWNKFSFGHKLAYKKCDDGIIPNLAFQTHK